MASNFSSLWQMCFSWIGTLLNMKLPVYLGDTSLSTLDIIIGTIGIFVSIAFVRALFKATFTIAGKDIQNEYHHQQNIKRLNEQTHQEYLDRRKNEFIKNTVSTWDNNDVKRLGR